MCDRGEFLWLPQMLVQQKSINRTNEVGFTLVEMLVASALTALLLTALTSFTISSTSAAQKEIRSILLRNTVSDSLRFIQDDLRRASSVISTESELRYVYQDDGEHRFTVIKADYREHKLKYCLDKIAKPLINSTCHQFYSMFDNDQVRLVNFTVTEGRFNQLKNNNKTTNRVLYELSVTAVLRELDEPFSLSVSIASR